MAVRIRGFRTVAGVHTLVTLVTVASAIAAQRPVAAQQGWASRNLRSVVVRQNGPTIAGEDGIVVPGPQPIETVTPRVVNEGQFEIPGDSQGVYIEGPAPAGTIVEGPVRGEQSYGGPVYEGSMDDGTVSEGYVSENYRSDASTGPVYSEDGTLIHEGYPPCGAPDCVHGCQHCMAGHGGHGRPWFNAFCEPIGLTQRLAGLIHDHCKDECWTVRGDALILWRNAPAPRPLYLLNPGLFAAPLPALDAGWLNSPAAGGGRLQLFKHDPCGDVLEVGYLYGGQFFAQQVRPFISEGYVTAPPGLDGNDFPPIRALDAVGAQVVGSIQSAEINHRHALGASTQFLFGFRWFNWYEQSLVADTYGAPDNLGADFYETTTTNNLWGGQIGLDTLLLRTGHGFRVEGLVKAGAYANNAGQNSSYLNLALGEVPYYASVKDNGWPASASFVGEVGLTGVLPIWENWDFRFGYLGLWLTGIAQPTKQLSGQMLAPGEPVAGSLSAVGTVVVQGLTLGLEGRW